MPAIKPTPAPEAVPDAPVTSATVTTAPTANQANFLDTVLVLGGMVLIGGVLLGLFINKDIGTANLPIIAGLAGTLLGTVIGGYAAYRWGASDAMKKTTATSTSTPS